VRCVARKHGGDRISKRSPASAGRIDEIGELDVVQARSALTAT
jgi:hypothetical protein